MECKNSMRVQSVVWGFGGVLASGATAALTWSAAQATDLNAFTAGLLVVMWAIVMLGSARGAATLAGRGDGGIRSTREIHRAKLTRHEVNNLKKEIHQRDKLVGTLREDLRRARTGEFRRVTPRQEARRH